MRPAYWRYIGDCDGSDLGYVGGKDQMILGYPAGPRGGVIDSVSELNGIYGLNTADPQARFNQRADRVLKKFEFNMNSYDTARNPQ